MRYLNISHSRGELDFNEADEVMWNFFCDKNSVTEEGETIGEVLQEFWSKGFIEHNGTTYNFVTTGDEGYLLEVPDDFNDKMLEEIHDADNWTYTEEG